KRTLYARGGLGEVFLADDEELGRTVALKEIKERRADQPDCRARFVFEAEVTGRLEHPGIVPVYGLGTYPDGRPFYAMRLIQGQTREQASADYHVAGQPAMALRSLLTRFVMACNAVAYAHSRGVIHRDVKPSNVMLGPFGETLVVDWGLAPRFAGVDEGLAAWERARAHAQRLVDEHPDVARRRDELADVLDSLGSLYRQLG